MFSEQNNNAYALQSLYSFDSSGQRIRSDQYSLAAGQTDWMQYPNAHPNWREYTYWNGNVLAEKDQNGVWTDYVYGNGRKIAMVGQQEQVLQVSGSYSGGWQGVGFTVAAPSLTNYMFRAGDVLLVRQRKYGANVHGGILIYGDGIGSFYNDQDGQRADDDTLGAGVWHNRRIPLDGLQGHTYSGLSMGGGTSSNYNFQFASVAVSSADGSVRTIFSGEAEGASFAGGIRTGSGAFVPVAADANAVHFYAQDQVGTTQMEVSAAGYPLWKGEFAPFGQQLDQNPTVNRFKFTGKERDGESGLDYFGARYYGSSMGRFMSPDPLLNSGRPDNPQTWNRYSYVLNNPLKMVDPTGLYNLDADCLKNKACAANAEKLRNGVADLTKAANGMKAGADKDRLLGALKTLGTENDGNNVGVSFAALGGSAAGHTDALADSSGKLTGFKITLDPSKNGSSDIFGINASHESTHINNLQDRSFSDFSDEYRAYQTSAAAASALWQYHGSQGTGTFTLNGKSGKSIIWNSSWVLLMTKSSQTT